jgi:hypothetical protein
MYVREEVGHASQGALLEAGALGLAAEVGEAPPGLGVRAEVKVEVGRRGARGLAREVPEGELPRPPKPKMTLEEAIVARRSVRDYSGGTGGVGGARASRGVTGTTRKPLRGGGS